MQSRSGHLAAIPSCSYAFSDKTQARSAVWRVRLPSLILIDRRAFPWLILQSGLCLPPTCAIQGGVPCPGSLSGAVRALVALPAPTGSCPETGLYGIRPRLIFP